MRDPSGFARTPSETLAPVTCLRHTWGAEAWKCCTVAQGLPTVISEEIGLSWKRRTVFQSGYPDPTQTQ